MKKITCFIESLAGGGAEHQMVHLATLLHQKGYKVEVVIYGDMPDHYILPAEINIKRLGQGKNRFNKFVDVFFYFIRVNTDCVISFRQACNFLVLLPLLFRSKKIKVIVGERNLSVGHPDFYEKALFNLLYYRANFIISNSFSQAYYLKSQNKKWINNVKTIINYTDISNYPKASQPISDDKIRIGIFARFNPQKNCLRFADAIALLKKMSKKKFEVIWYGNINGAKGELSQHYLDFQNKINALNISDVLKIKAAVKDVTSLFSEFHVLCLPSLYEGFSNSIAEGICCGMPMLVSNVSDNSLMVKNGINGYLFDPYKIESIVEAFCSFFYTTVNGRIEFSKNSLNIAKELFDNNVFIENYCEIIDE